MTTLTHPTLTVFHPSRAAGGKPSWLARAAETIHLWRRRARERQRLAELSLYELHDFGVTTADRFNELSKPFWRG